MIFSGCMLILLEEILLLLALLPKLEFVIGFGFTFELVFTGGGVTFISFAWFPSGLTEGFK